MVDCEHLFDIHYAENIWKITRSEKYIFLIKLKNCGVRFRQYVLKIFTNFHHSFSLLKIRLNVQQLYL